MESGQSLQAYQELSETLVSGDAVDRGLSSGSLVALHGRSRNVLIGEGVLIKVNTSIGCSDLRDFQKELDKLEVLSHVGYGPDIMMDLSIVRADRPLYSHIIERLGVPVGTLPHYLCFRPRKGIDRGQLLEEIERQAEAGVTWMTLHLAVRRSLYELARRTRGTAVTARGGGIVVEDMYLRNSSESLLAQMLPEILDIMGRHGTILSLGTTFRPANVVDALDEVHVKEMELQGQFIDEANRLGVPVMLEAVGHMPLSKAMAFTTILRSQLRYRLPVMTLGPIPTDAAVGEDHIANAIGGAYLAMAGGTNVLNSITREEHTGKVPNCESIMEGLRAARIAAHAVNISKFAMDTVDLDTAEKRAKNYTCVVEGGLFTESAKTRFTMGCTRCGSACPLVVNFVIDQGRLLVRAEDSLQPNVPR